MGECHHIVERYFTGQEGRVVTCVNFETTRQLTAASDAGLVQQFDIDGSKIGLPTSGDCVAFSDGSRFISSEGGSAVVRNSRSGTIAAFLPSVIRSLDRYCFSTSGGFGIGVSKGAAYVWDITDLAARFVETFTLHDSNISSLVFSSSFQHPATNRSDSGRSVALPRTKP